MRPECRRVRWSAFGAFPCALVVIGFVRVRSAHSSTPKVSFGCVRVRSVYFRVPWGSSGLFGCVRSLPVRPGYRIPAHPGFVGLDRMHAVHSRTPWRSSGSLGSVPRGPRGSAGSFRCVQFIPVRPGVRSMRSRVP